MRFQINVSFYENIYSNNIQMRRSKEEENKMKKRIRMLRETHFLRTK